MSVVRKGAGFKQPTVKAEAFRGASNSNKNMAPWSARSLSGDAAILPARKQMAARTSDLIRNNGYAAHGLQLHVDNIVGHQFQLNYSPFWKILGIDGSTEEAMEFVKMVEAFWKAYTTDQNCVFDSERKRTFIDFMRSGAASRVSNGESLLVVERTSQYGLSTTFKQVNPDRLSNPNDRPDANRLRGGISIGPKGDARAYHIRSAHESDARFIGSRTNKWQTVRKLTPWGRPNVIHVFEAREDGQTRGISPFAAIAEGFKKLTDYDDSIINKAIMQAMFAMVIESDADTETAMEAIGADSFEEYLEKKGDFHEGIDFTFGGQRVPHLLPKETLHMLATETMIDIQFHDKLLAKIAAGLGVSRQQFTNDWSGLNFSTAKTAMGEAWRYFLGAKAVGADREATLMFSVVLEEMVARNFVKLPQSPYLPKNMNQWEQFLAFKSAWLNCTWIGPARTMVDGLKEIKQLVLEVEAGFETYEGALGRLGRDYRDVFEQQVRETRERVDAGLGQPSWLATQALAPDPTQESPEVNNNSQTA